MRSIDQKVEVVVEGIDDAAIVAEIQHVVGDVVPQTIFNGTWLIAVAPSETAGRWRVVVKNRAGQHTMSFAAPVARLAVLTAQHVRRYLTRRSSS